jgi:hypothetical protein
LPLANGFATDGGFKDNVQWDVACCEDSLVPSASCDGRRYTGLGEDDEIEQLNFDTAPNAAGFIANGLQPEAMLLGRGEAKTDEPKDCQYCYTIIVNCFIYPQKAVSIP